MRNPIYIIKLLTICMLCSCGKEASNPFVTTFHIGSKSNNANDYKVWIILQDEKGNILDIKNSALSPDSSEQTYSTYNVSEEQVCDITIAFLQISKQQLSLCTYKKIPSGKKLRPDIFGTVSDYRKAWAEIEIADMPNFEKFECVGTTSNDIDIQSPAPNVKIAISQMKTGGIGALLRWKAIGEPNFRSYWLNVNSDQPFSFHKASISANDFNTDMTKRELQLPFSADWWTQIRGVVNSTGLADFAYIADRQDDEVVSINKVEFEQPNSLSFQSYWIFATNTDTVKFTELEWLLPIDAPLLLPQSDFKLIKFNLNSNGDIHTDYAGDFDALHILVFGNAGKVSWQIEGSPDDLKQCVMPRFPDSLKQKWPELSGFTLGQTRCSDYNSLFTFKQYLDVDRSETLWRARLGFRGQWQHWRN